MKNRPYSDFSKDELKKGYAYMSSQVQKAPKEHQYKLKNLLNYYWKRFQQGKFKVDGATFIDEEKGQFFNIWWFIHDGRNAEGYVMKEVDYEMVSIMTLVDIPPKHFMQAVPLLHLSFVNKWKHIITFNYKRRLPKDLILIK